MDYTPILKAIISLLAVVVTSYCIPLLRVKLGEMQYDKLLKYVSVAVQAAEQLFPVEEAQKKKVYVFNYIQSLGFRFNDDEIDTAIESAVLSLHNALYGVIE